MTQHYYRDLNNSEDVYVYEVELVRMTEVEIQLHLNPPARYWSDSTTLVLTKANFMQGMHLASEVEIEELLPIMQRKEADAEIASLRALADSAMAPLQDAVEIEESTADEEALLILWKKYRLALNRLPEQLGYPQSIDWPAAPQ